MHLLKAGNKQMKASTYLQTLMMQTSKDLPGRIRGPLNLFTWSPVCRYRHVVFHNSKAQTCPTLISLKWSSIYVKNIYRKLACCMLILVQSSVHVSLLQTAGD